MTRSPFTLSLILVVAVASVLTPDIAGAGEHSFGFGARYWKTLDDLDSVSEFEDIDENGYSLVGSYRFQPRGLFSLQFDLERYDEGFGGADDDAWAPQALVLFGHGLYVGAGAGVLFADVLGESTSDPFYLARGGFEFAVLPHLSVDIYANYITDAYDEVTDFDSDAITLGATARFSVGSRR